MAIKKISGKIIIAAVFLLLGQAALYAQEEGYFIEYDEGRAKFIQRLTWEKTEYALYYEVQIHVLDNGYREHSEYSTEDDLLLVSLPPGKYRYSVTPFNLLKERGEPSVWKEFEVLPAYQPVIYSFTPDVFYLDRIADRELRISGEGLLEESEIYLKGSAGSLYPDRVIIADDNRSATLIFDDMKLVPDDYDIYIKNPGGLSTQSGTFVVGYRKPLDFFLKLAYTPMLPVYRKIAEVENRDVSFAGMTFSFEVISSKRGDINGGLELASSVNYFNTGFLYNAFDLNIVLQKRFDRGRMAVSFRFGVGGAAVSGSGTSANDDIAMKLNTGVEYMVRLYKVFYFETGVDFNIDIASNYCDFIKPRLGIVWQF